MEAVSKSVFHKEELGGTYGEASFVASGSSATFVYTSADSFGARSLSNELFSKDEEDDVVAVVLDEVCWFVHLNRLYTYTGLMQGTFKPNCVFPCCI